MKEKEMRKICGRCNRIETLVDSLIDKHSGRKPKVKTPNERLQDCHQLIELYCEFSLLFSTIITNQTHSFSPSLTDMINRRLKREYDKRSNLFSKMTRLLTKLLGFHWTLEDNNIPHLPIIE